MFYHDIKPHMSPSALAQWLNGRGQFIRSYFAGEKGPETKAMSAGTQIHALVEAGIIKAKHAYDCNEQEVKVPVDGTDFWFMGKPDSFEGEKDIESDVVRFVDYKSGKDNGWEEKLPTDIKMRATAWLVWRHMGMPESVIGYIEYIQTTWDPDQKKVVPVDGKETEVVSITYSYDELEAFTKVIANAMRDVNTFYEKWKESTGEFVSNSDTERYAELKKEVEEREMEMDELGERILIQMDAGGEQNHKTLGGSFFVKETKTYEYPPTLRINYLEMGIVLEDAEKIAAAVKAAKSNYELANEPKGVKRTISFRAKK